MFNQKDIVVANKTSRGNGAIGKNAIVPISVRSYIELFCDRDDTLILDFGAGKDAIHTQILSENGWMVTAYEFGDNVDPRVHNELALMQMYDIVYASNVLNVQSSVEMAQTTIKQVTDVLKPNGKFFVNYPIAPRKSEMDERQIERLLLEQFSVVNRVSVVNRSPMWLCEK